MRYYILFIEESIEIYLKLSKIIQNFIGLFDQSIIDGFKINYLKICLQNFSNYFK